MNHQQSSVGGGNKPTYWQMVSFPTVTLSTTSSSNVLEGFMVELGHHTLAKSPFIVGPQDIVALLPETNFELLRLKQTINLLECLLSSHQFS